MVPTSHRLISEAGAGNPVPPLPPAINLAAKAVTVVMFEGRLLHGTGVNKVMALPARRPAAGPASLLACIPAPTPVHTFATPQL